MGIFLQQDRYLKVIRGKMPSSFPAQTVARITFAPEDAFGVLGDTKRTTVPKGRECAILWDANAGVFSFSEADLIQVVHVDFTGGGVNAKLDGNEMRLTFLAKSLDQANSVVASANRWLPVFLTFHLQTFVWIKRFEVDIAEGTFNFEAVRGVFGITLATTAHNTEKVVESLGNWVTMDESCARILEALSYFRHAQRLMRLDLQRESMMAEVILNLVKALEIVFSSDREQLRQRAAEWGFESDFIEERIIPLLLLRNDLDIAHAAATPLHPDQYEIVSRFADAAMHSVRLVLNRMGELLRQKKVTLEPISKSLSKDKEKLLAAIESYVASGNIPKR
jgi:hypothetical protein